MTEIPALSESHSERSEFSFRARFRSLGYAGRGIAWLFRYEHNAWLHLCAGVVVIATGWSLDASLSDWRWLVVSIAAVWAAEAFNSAVERLCNRVCPHFDPAIGQIKDLAAGGVLIVAICAAAIGFSVLLPLLLEKIA